MKAINLLLFFLLVTITAIGQQPKHILITYYSKTGHTKALAEEVAKGVKLVKGVELKIKTIEQTTHSDLLAADAIILGSPVHNANAAPEVLKFIQDWPFTGEPLKNKLGAVFVTAGGISAGEELVQVNLLHSMMIFGMIIIGGDHWTSAFGTSAITGEGVYKTGQQLDSLFIKKAHNFGKRVAEVSKKINN